MLFEKVCNIVVWAITTDTATLLYLSMNKDCQNKFNETQAVRCECAKSEIKSKEKDLNTQFFSCANIQSGMEKDTAGFEVDDIIYQACTQKDPCHKSSQSDVEWKY